MYLKHLMTTHQSRSFALMLVFSG